VPISDPAWDPNLGLWMAGTFTARTVGSYQISCECNDPAGLARVTTPSPVMKLAMIKLASWGIGLVVIIVINYLRLVAVIVLASRIPLVLFDLIHDFLFQIGMIIVCLVLWLIMISIEHRRWDRRVALYILCVCVVSIMLETLCFGLARIVPSLPTSFTSFMVPTFAIIISAFGETWYKKAKWLLSYTVLFVIAGRLLVATGILNSPDNLTTLMLTLVVALYVIVYMGISLATVILFIGRRPSRLWGQI